MPTLRIGQILRGAEPWSIAKIPESTTVPSSCEALLVSQLRDLSVGEELELNPVLRALDRDPSVEGTTFGVTLQELALSAPDEVAVTCGAEALTRAELFARAYDLGLRLVDSGVR